MADETATRDPVTRERIFATAVAIADSSGLAGVTMRTLARELGVEPMSLYYHVANKQALLDGVVDALMVELEERLGGFTVPAAGADWMPLLRARILTAREVLLRHPWAPSLLESRTTMQPRVVRYFDSVLGILVEGGFDYDQAHHALHALGSKVLGFDQELFAPADAGDPGADGSGDAAAAELMAQLAAEVPYLTAMLGQIAHDDPDSTLGWCDDQAEFEFGLDIVLEGLERRRLGRVGPD